MELLKNIKSPYAFIAVAMATLAAVVMLVHPHAGVESAAFKFAAALIGGFVVQASVAVMVKALKTVLLMIGAALLLLVTAITFTDASVFKDAAVETVALGAAGGVIVVINLLLERHKGQTAVADAGD